MNTVILLGNLGATPVLRHVGSGKAVLNFTMAVDKRHRQGDRQVDTTNWIDCTCWGATAVHHAKFLTKGAKILVKGELNVRQWIDRDGKSRHNVEVVAQTIEWISLVEETPVAPTAEA
jgi:single-strand DNA-binding protein